MPIVSKTDRNTAPYVIRRFANQDFIYFVEDVLVDRKNKVMYVRGQNRSFANYGVLRTFSQFQADEAQHTVVNQSGEAKLSASLGMARGTMERFISKAFNYGAKQSRELLEKRLNQQA